MLSMSVLCVLVSATILKLCSGQCHVVSTDLNASWRAADVVEQVVHDYYQSLALGPEDNDDNQKRFLAVFSIALFLYTTGNVTDEMESIREAAHRTTNLLDRTADELSGPLRSMLSLLMMIIEGPLTDVQIACPFDVREAECKANLTQMQAKKIKRCPSYANYIDIYNRGVVFVTSCGMENLLDELAIASDRGSDADAINLFTEFVSIKHTSTIHWYKNILQEVERIPLSCDIFSFI